MQLRARSAACRCCAIARSCTWPRPRQLGQAEEAACMPEALACPPMCSRLPRLAGLGGWL
jgi:hypothetical protein